MTLGHRRVTSRNAEAVAADVDAQLEVCREAIAKRGVAQIVGAWMGSSAGCEHAGSLLAQALNAPGSGVRFEQDGITLAVTVFGTTRDGEDFSFPAAGTVVGHYVAMIDPGNSDYLLQGEATEAAVVLRPDAKSILAAWSAWAGPPKLEELSSCVISLHRLSGEATSGSVPEPRSQPRRNPYDESIEAFARRVTHARGTGGARGGALLVLVPSDTSAHLAVGGEEAKIVTPEKVTKIVDQDVLPAMRAGRVQDAIQAAINSIVTALDAGSRPR